VFLKSIELFFLWLFFLLILISACETNFEESITGDLLYRNPGELKSGRVHVDSLYGVRGVLGENSYTFAGKYRGISASTLIMFAKPTTNVLDSLVSAAVKVTVFDIWSDGEIEFGLYEVSNDWSDSVYIDPDDFLPHLGDPVSTYADTTSSPVTLSFELQVGAIDYIRSWPSRGSFLITGIDTGLSMVASNSLFSNHIPHIEFIVRNSTGTSDTTKVSAVATSYFFDAGQEQDEVEGGTTAFVSDAGARGFVTKLAYTDSIPSSAAINRCTLSVNVLNSLITEEKLTLGFYQLTEPLYNINNPQYVSSTFVEHVLTPDIDSFDIDITHIFDEWHKNPDTNYGMLVRPITMSTSLNQAVLVLQDSLTVLYTSLPEVE